MNEKKYTVIESNDNYVVCLGSGLSWSEAHLLLISEIMDSYSEHSLQNVNLFELEANSPGLGMSFEVNNYKNTYYILDDPGNIIAE